MLERLMDWAFLFTGLGCHPLSPSKERLSGHSLCGSRALLFNTVASPAASCRGLLHPSTWSILPISLGERGGGSIRENSLL